MPDRDDPTAPDLHTIRPPDPAPEQERCGGRRWICDYCADPPCTGGCNRAHRCPGCPDCSKPPVEPSEGDMANISEGEAGQGKSDITPSDHPSSEQHGPFDADELVRWAETYGHPEEWAKRAQAAHARAEAAESRLRECQEALDDLMAAVAREIADIRSGRATMHAGIADRLAADLQRAARSADTQPSPEGQ